VLYCKRRSEPYLGYLVEDLTIVTRREQHFQLGIEYLIGGLELAFVGEVVVER